MKKKRESLKILLTLIGFVLIVTTSCKKKESNSNSTLLTVGQSYQGGIIAYILQPGDPGYDVNVQHGLIAAPTDQSTGIRWNNGGFTVTGATATALGTGNDNTATIVNSQGAGNYAAKLCSDLVLGGHNDWFLPSRNELDKLWSNKTVIGGFANPGYWSSSEFGLGVAWIQYFDTGGLNYIATQNECHVRAVRAF